MLSKIILILTAITITACGGDDDEATPTTASGQFKDSNTSGLSYVSGDQSGVTGADGSFTYEEGNTVTFSVGSVEIGTATGKSVVTPIDLVSGGSSDSVEVKNIVRFLVMLDSDGNPSNGINIHPNVQTIADSWSSVDFSDGDLDGQLGGIISDAASMDGGTHVVPDANTAKLHLESTLRCVHAGAFKGTFTGDDSGIFGFLVDALTGEVNGAANDNVSLANGEDWVELSGAAVSLDQTAGFVAGSSVDGVTFSGNFTSVNNVSGTWLHSSDNASGTYSGSRIGGAVNAKFRFTGLYEGDGEGIFAFDVDDSGNVTGISVDMSDTVVTSVTGTVTGDGTLNIDPLPNGVTVTNGVLNTLTGALSGNWQNVSEGAVGTFSGNGCALN